MNQLSLFGPEPDPPRRRGAPVGPAEVAPELRHIASALPANLRLGTSSWSFPGWGGVVYDRPAPAARLAKEGLAAYAMHPLFRSVGVDRTYYAPVEASVFQAYADVVEPDFRFLVKALEDCGIERFPRHPRYGDRGGKKNPHHLDPLFAAETVVGPYVEGLGDRAGVLLFQFPPQDLRWDGPESFARRLGRFLARLPAGPRYAVEVRNRDLFVPAYAAALRDTGAAHCFNVHTAVPSVMRQAEVIPPGEQPVLLVRWMLAAGLQYDQAVKRYSPFDELVDEDLDSRTSIARMVLDAARVRQDAFVIVNNKAEGSSPLSVFALAREIARRREATP